MDPTLAVLLVDTLANQRPPDRPCRRDTRLGRQRSALATGLGYAASIVRRSPDRRARDTAEPAVCSVS